jgi:hypothetical protein
MREDGVSPQEEFTTNRIQYADFGASEQRILDLQRNFFNHVFANLPIELGLLDAFFKDNECKLPGSAWLVRAAIARPYSLWTYALSTSTFTALKEFLSPSAWTTQIEKFRMPTRAYVESFPYFQQYIQEYWIHGHFYDKTGNHIPTRINKEPDRLTFAAYQSTRIGNRFSGLQEIIPEISTASLLQDQIHGVARVDTNFLVQRLMTNVGK